MFSIWNYIVITAMLGILAYLDYKTMEVSFTVSLLMVVSSTVILVIFGEFNIIDSLVTMLVAFLIYFVAALFGAGGGDAIIMGLLGWCVGLKTLFYIVIFAGIAYMIFGIIKIFKEKNLQALSNQYPYIPFVFIGWLVYMIMSI